MAVLPDETHIVTRVGNEVLIVNRDTQEVLMRTSAEGDNIAKAQRTIYALEELSPESKCFAHFWCGYFYASAVMSKQGRLF